MMRKNYQRWMCLSLLVPAFAFGQTRLELNDLGAFTHPGNNWKIAASVSADLQKPNKLSTTPGTGILVNTIDRKNTDLFTVDEYGDMELELDFMLAAGANSGIYLQGRYEFQLNDSWGEILPSQQGNGAIYPRWNDNAPEGQEAFDGHAPRMNASRAPGTWQHLKLVFQAPRIDANGQKLANARILSAELNGVLIHENVELTGPTRGAVSTKEVNRAPLRFQGDHGAVAFRNIVIKPVRPTQPAAAEQPDPILIQATTPTLHRSFIDIPGSGKLTHAISVGHPAKINFTYDALTGAIALVWRGEFLDATPMWHDRGNGTAKPRGAVQYFGKPLPALAILNSRDAVWPADTTGLGFAPRGYRFDKDGMPTFQYVSGGQFVRDAIRVAPGAKGITRELTINNLQPGAYVLLAADREIVRVNDYQYIIGDRAYYIHVEKAGGAPILRDGSGGNRELIIPAKNKIAYSILF